MRRLNMLLCLTLITFDAWAENSTSNSQHSVYQDLIIDGSVVSKGWGPDCTHRYEAIKQVLDQYNRPITVLDIGANYGYFSLKIAQDYDSTVVAIEGMPHLVETISKNSKVNNIIAIQKWLCVEDLEKLVDQEYFDVVLCSFVLHQISNWKKCFDLILKLGDHIIIETPPSNDAVVKDRPTVPDIVAFLDSKNAKILTETERYTPGTYAKMYLFENMNTPKELPIEYQGPKYPLIRNYDVKEVLLDDTYLKLPKGVHYGTLKEFNVVFPKIDPVNNQGNLWVQGTEWVNLY